MTNIIQTDIGPIAEDWEIFSVGDLFEIQQGKSISKKNRVGNNQLCFLRTKNVLWGRIDLSDLDQMNFTQFEMEKLYLKRGDLLLCEGGDVGRTAIWEGAIDNCLFQNHLHRLRVKDERLIDSKYALYWFWYAFGVANLYLGSSNVTTIPNLSGFRLRALQIPLPNIKEQSRVVHVLNTIRIAIEQQSRLIDLTQELKSVLMQKLFTEGLGGESQKETEIGLVPESWNVLPFSNFATLQRGKDLTKSDFRTGCVPVAGSNGVIGYHDTPIVTAPGVTVGRSGSVGRVKYYETDFWAHNTSLYVKDFHCNHPRFTAYYLEYLDLSRFKSGASVPTLDRNSFRKIPVAIPHMSEQINIAENLFVIDQKIVFSTKKKTHLEELFHTLLHKLMTGEIRVNDLDLPEI